MPDTLALEHQLFQRDQLQRFKTTDRVMGAILVIQFVVSFGAELIFNPFSWSGASAQWSPHLINTLEFGSLITFFPAYLCFAHAGAPQTRYAVTIAQFAWSALLIHITGGRIETHFHVFVSLAILSNYRDWKVIPIATRIILFHHAILGNIYPREVFGVSNQEPWRWVEHSAWVVFEDIVLTWFCITGTREMQEIATREALLQQTKESIEQQVEDRTMKLGVAMEELSRASEGKSQFLRNVSHEVRTPLNGILGSLQILKKFPLGRESADLVRDIGVCSASLSNILDNVLTLSDLDNGRLSMESSELDFVELMEDIWRSHIELAETKGLKFELQMPPTRICFQGDSRRLQQIVSNLLGNAVKFTETGAIQVEVTIEPREEAIEQLSICITDTGPGIPIDKIPRIFEPFQQLDGSSTRTYGGVGTGIYLSKTLVEAMGGAIAVESQVAVGTKVLVRLPVRRIWKKASNPTRTTFPALGPLNVCAMLIGSDHFRMCWASLPLLAAPSPSATWTKALPQNF